MKQHGLGAAVVFVAALCFYGSYARYGAISQDEGWLLDSAARVAAGQVPHRDFTSIYPAGRYYAAAALLEISGGSVLAVRWMFAAMLAATCSVAFAVGRRLMPESLALAAALSAMVLPGPWHKAFYALVPLCGLYCLVRWLESERRAWLFAAGAVTGVGALFRQDTALYGFVACCAAAILRSRDGESTGLSGARASVSRAASNAAAIAAGTACVLVPVAAALAWAGALPQALEQLTSEAASVGHPRISLRSLVPFFGADARAGGTASARLEELAAPLYWIPFLLGGTALVRGWRSIRSGSSPACVALFGTGLVLVLSANQVLRHDVLIRFLQISPLAYILAFELSYRLLSGWFGKWTARRRVAPVSGITSPTPRAVPIAASLALGAVLPLYLGSLAWLQCQTHGLPVEYTGSPAIRFLHTAQMPARGTTLCADRSSARYLPELVAYVTSRTDTAEPIFVLRSPSSLYFLAERRNPTHRTRIRPEQLSREEKQSLAREVRESGCRTVITTVGYLRRCQAFCVRYLGGEAAQLARFGPYLVLEIEPWSSTEHEPANRTGSESPSSFPS